MEREASAERSIAMITDRLFTQRMLQTVFAVAGVTVLVITLWQAREALLLVYVRALIAMGFAPVVKLLERGPGKAHRRIPRWLAILLIYIAVLLVFVVVALIVVPPLVAQANALWATLPGEFDKIQALLMRYNGLRRRVTLAEAVSNAPSGSGAAVGTVIGALSSFAGGLLGLVTVLILSFYFLVEAKAMSDYFIRF